MEKNIPIWVEYLSALLVPVLAAFGGYIAWQQMLTAKRKLKHDLFDRRFAIFDATRRFLISILQEGAVRDDELWKYRTGIADARFLLDHDTELYLEGIWESAVKLQSVQRRSKNPPSESVKDALIKEESNILILMSKQLPILQDKFAKSLKLES